jgi:hypothetical protein
MFKKLILLAIICVLVLTPTVSSSNLEESSDDFLQILRDALISSSSINIDYDTDELEEPFSISEIHKIIINISYKISGPFSNLIERRLSKKGEKVNIELDVKPTNDWCEVEVSPNNLELNIKTEWVYIETEILVTFTENAPAFLAETIEVKAIAPAIKGSFDLTLVKASESSTEIDILPGYMPVIDVIPEATIYEITPFNITDILFVVKNLGNGKTVVNIELENISENWNISFPKDILLEAEDGRNSRDVSIQVQANSNFKNVTELEFKFTASYYADSSLKGRPIFYWIVFNNDGSYKDPNEGLDANLTTIISGFIVILLALLIIFFTLRKK